jgi:hypothetical protein
MDLMRTCRWIPWGTIFLLFLCAPASAQRIPTRVGTCVDTKIKEISTRLEDTPGSGSSVLFVNGVYQVSYSTITEIEESRVGDPVRLCLASIPEDCPKGDDRPVLLGSPTAAMVHPPGRVDADAAKTQVVKRKATRKRDS